MLVGKEIASYREVKVSYDRIYQSYKDMVCEKREDEDILTRVFILVLLGSIIFCDKSKNVYLYYIPSLEKVHEIANYNWGGAALVCCYCHMDAMSRAKLRSIGGFWQAWEVIGFYLFYLCKLVVSFAWSHFLPFS